MSLHIRIKRLFEDHPVTMGFLLAAMVVEGWRLTILYLISTNTLIPALIFALLIQSTIFFLAISGYVKASVMLGIISAILSGISFIPFLDLKFKESTTVVLAKHVALPEHKSFKLWNEQESFNAKYYEELKKATKENAQIDTDNEELKKQYPTLKKEAGYDYYAAIIVVLIASIFPSTVVVVVSHQVSRLQLVTSDVTSVLIQPMRPVVYNKPELANPVVASQSEPVDRNKQLALDWANGKYLTITELASAYKISAQRASTLLKKYKEVV